MPETAAQILAHQPANVKMINPELAAITRAQDKGKEASTTGQSEPAEKWERLKEEAVQVTKQLERAKPVTKLESGPPKPLTKWVRKQTAAQDACAQRSNGPRETGRLERIRKPVARNNRKSDTIITGIVQTGTGRTSIGPATGKGRTQNGLRNKQKHQG